MARRSVAITSLKVFAPDCLDEVELIASLGLSDEEICAVCEISAAKLNKWRLRYRDFDQAILKGRLRPDMEVIKALYAKAVGYSRTRQVVTEGGEVKEVDVPIEPDLGAIKFWLTNRSENWRDKREVDLNLTLTIAQRLGGALRRLDAIDVTPDPALPAPVVPVEPSENGED